MSQTLFINEAKFENYVEPIEKENTTPPKKLQFSETTSNIRFLLYLYFKMIYTIPLGTAKVLKIRIGGKKDSRDIFSFSFHTIYNLFTRSHLLTLQAYVLLQNQIVWS